MTLVGYGWRATVVVVIFWLLVAVLVRLVPVLRRGRTVILDRPEPGPLADAQRAVDRLIAAGFDAELVESDDSGLNVWASVGAGGAARPDERYVVRVPRRQASAASRW